MLLAIDNISKAYGDNQVLNNVSFTLDTGQKIGLVGANGVGKSTLLKIIVGEVEPDSGSVNLNSTREVGYLPQALATVDQQTVAQWIDAAQGQLNSIEARLRTIEQQMTRADSELDALLIEYSALTDEFEVIRAPVIAFHDGCQFAMFIEL